MFPTRRFGASNYFVGVSLLLIVTALSGCDHPEKSRPVSLFVAASLGEVVDSLALVYLASNSDFRYQRNIGASSTLARQIRSGAAADVFFSADTVWSTYVRTSVSSSKSWPLSIQNELVLYSRDDLFVSVRDLVNARRVALADPSHVPAGQYARHALTCLSIWDAIDERVIPMGDVRAALNAAYTRSVDAAMVYRTDVQSTPANEGFVVEIPAACQPDIRTGLVILADEGRNVRGFVEFAASTESYPIWRSFGFKAGGD